MDPRIPRMSHIFCMRCAKMDALVEEGWYTHGWHFSEGTGIMSIAITCSCGNTLNAGCPRCGGELEPAYPLDVTVLPEGDLRLSAAPKRKRVTPPPVVIDDDDDGSIHYSFSRDHEAQSERPKADAGPPGFWGRLGEIRMAGQPSCACYGPRSRRALIGSGKAVQVLDMQASKRAGLFCGHRAAVTSVALCRDEKSALSGDADGNLLCWDLESHRITHRLRGHEGSILALAATPDSDFVLSGGADGITRMWHLAGAGGACRIADTGCREAVMVVAFSQDGRHLLAGGSKGRVDCWSVGSGIAVASLRGADQPIACVRSAEGAVTAIAGPSRDAGVSHPAVWRWNAETSRAERPAEPWRSAESVPTCVALDITGKRMLVAGRMGGFSSRKLLPASRAGKTVAGVVGEVRDAVRDFFSFVELPARSKGNQPKPRYVLEVWSLSSGSCLHTYPTGVGEIVRLAVSPDNTRILAALRSGDMHVFAMPAT